MQMVGKLKSHDKNIAALCVCCGKLKGIFHSLRSKKCALYDIYIKSIIKSLMNSNLDLKPLKRRNICTQSNFWQQFKKNFYSSVFEVISQRKMPINYEWWIDTFLLSALL